MQRVRYLVQALSLLIVSGCATDSAGTTLPNIQALRGQFVQLACDELATCDFDSRPRLFDLFPSQRECLQWFEPIILRAFPDSDPATTHFDAVQAAQCLADAQEMIGCERLLTGFLPPSCRRLVTGVLENGSVCSVDYECVTGLCAKEMPGPLCATGICAETLPEGEGCTRSAECGELWCFAGMCVPPDAVPARRAVGEACRFELHGQTRYASCGEDWCDLEGDGLCHTRFERGEVCSGYSSCARGLVCQGGTCIDYALQTEAGTPCEDSATASLQCNPLYGLYCEMEEGAASGTCARVAEGQCVTSLLSVDDRQGCAVGEYCAAEGTFGTCEPKLPDGQACIQDNQCMSGLCSDEVCGPCP